MMGSTYDKTFIPDEATPAPKRIIVCCDGTWQSSTSLDPKNGCPSNVTRLCRTLANAGTGKDGRVWQQLTYYDAGIGTGDITDVEKKRQGNGLPFPPLEIPMQLETNVHKAAWATASSKT
jgi:uncharacterized protein (DUF2235 family)